ncbi:MAG: 3-ketoacyl-ACP reductase [Anaerolineae bacterium]|nr:3-ketoacyl-ACP reductase [Anaerolineae bacterium]
MKPVALVTGGASGIGFGIAMALARAGYDLVLCGRRDSSTAADALARLRTANCTALYHSADIAIAEERRQLIETARAHFGALHVLVNNAGVAPAVRTDLLEATEESFERVMRINLQGPYFLTQLAARWMVEQHHADAHYSGCIVNISSISAEVASINRGEYCISKAGVSMATKLWAVRLAQYGIGVYEVRPGIIATEMTAGVKDKYDRLIDEGLLLESRWGTADDIGKAVAALATGQIPYATGQVLTLDGGLTMPRL